MASKIRKKTQNLLQRCPGCCEDYNQTSNLPKILPTCQHPICVGCVIKRMHNKQVRCPTCQVLSSVKGGNPCRLKTNFYIVEYMDVSAVAKKKTGICPFHDDQRLFFYCKTCETPICQSCTVLNHEKVEGHMIITIQEARGSCLDTACEVQKEAVLLQVKLQEKQQVLVASKQALRAQKNESMRVIDEFFDAVQEEVERQRQDIHDDLDGKYEFDQDMIVDEEREVESSIKSVENAVDTLLKLPKEDVNDEVVSTVSHMKHVVKNGKIVQASSDEVSFQWYGCYPEQIKIKDSIESLCQESNAAVEAWPLPAKLEVVFPKLLREETVLIAHVGHEMLIRLQVLDQEGVPTALPPAGTSLEGIEDIFGQDYTYTSEPIDEEACITYTMQGKPKAKNIGEWEIKLMIGKGTVLDKVEVVVKP